MSDLSEQQNIDGAASTLGAAPKAPASKRG